MSATDPVLKGSGSSSELPESQSQNQPGEFQRLATASRPTTVDLRHGDPEESEQPKSFGTCRKSRVQLLFSGVLLGALIVFLAWIALGG